MPPLWDFINWFSSPPAGSSYTYHMQRADGRIVIGANSASGDHFDDSVADPAVTERILNELRETYPALAEVQAEQVWTGVTSWTADGFPWVGELPSMPGCFVAAGFTEGMVQAFSSGRVVAHLLTGAEPPQPFNPRYLPTARQQRQRGHQNRTALKSDDKDVGTGAGKINLMMIISDQHRWDCLGEAGNKIIKTPVLDQLAKDGAHFTQAYTVCP